MGMLELGIILLIVGLALVLLPVPLPNIDAVGWLLAVVGVILILIAVVDVGGAHAAALAGVYEPRTRRLLSRVRMLLGHR